MMLLISCNSQKVKELNIVLMSGTEKFDYTNQFYVRKYLNHTDSVFVDLSLKEKNKISSLYNKYDISDFQENYNPKPKNVEIPSIPIEILINGHIKIKIEDGDYSYINFLKVKKINSFYKEIIEMIRKKDNVKKLKPSDIIFL